MNRSRIGLLMVLFAAAGLSSGLTLQGGRPQPNGNARQRGCRTGGLKDMNVLFPEWVSVEPGDQPRVVEGIVRVSHVSYHDVPFSHDDHDQNGLVQLDPAYSGMISDSPDTEKGVPVFEIEWDIAHFPQEFWPAEGDRIWAMGRWIFDCGHPPYRTEIHPPQAMAVTRAEPFTFQGDSAPSIANKTYIYIHGKGGYYDAPVGGKNIEFDIPLPPAPLRPGPIAAPAGRPIPGRISPALTGAGAPQIAAQVVSTPLGGPAPTLTPVPAQNKVHVVYPLASVPANPGGRFAAVVATGWRSPIAARQLRVNFVSVKINEDHDPGPFQSGEWKFWVSANGNWFKVPGMNDVDNGDTVKINHSIDVMVPENGTLRIETAGWEDDCDSHFGVKRPLPTGPSPSLISAAGCFVNDNDPIGLFNWAYSAGQNFGVGDHDFPSARNPEGDKDTNGDYRLKYTITEVRRFTPGAGARP